MVYGIHFKEDIAMEFFRVESRCQEEGEPTKVGVHGAKLFL